MFFASLLRDLICSQRELNVEMEVFKTLQVWHYA